MANRIRQFAMLTSLIAAAVLSATPGQSGTVARRAPPATEIPPYKALELRLLAEPKGELNAKLVIYTEQIEPMPKTIPYPAGDTDLVLKTDKEHPGAYSTLFHVDVGNLRAQASAELAFLQSRPLGPPPRRSARFGLLPSRGSSALTQKVAIANLRSGLTSFDKLTFDKSPEIQVAKLVLLNGDIRATLFGKTVPVSTFNKVDALVAPADIAPELSLVITDTRVVQDPARTYDLCGNAGNPNGVWTFNHVMTAMANQAATGISPAQFTWNWLTSFATDQTINGNFSAARHGFITAIRDTWLNASGGVTLDMTKAPARLLAIVSRTDLSSVAGAYGTSRNGEARLVFGLLDAGNPCIDRPATVIFEYAIKKPSCEASKAWIKSWADLSNSFLGEDLNVKLQALTESFVAANADTSQLPNRSAISQVRVNDFLGGPWTLFESRLDQSATGGLGQLKRSTVKQTPDIGFHDDPAKIAELADYITFDAGGILTGTNTVPDKTAAGTPFLGAEALESSTSFTWTNTPFVSLPVSSTVLRLFSRNTCNACHTGDGNDGSGAVTLFTHIAPRLPGTASQLSPFLFDDNSPGNGFQDDLARRQAQMAAALNSSCLVFPLVNHLNAVD